MYPFVTGKPFPALPYVTFTCAFLDDGHPPVEKDQNHESDYPFEKKVYYVENTEDQKPKASVFASLIC